MLQHVPEGASTDLLAMLEEQFLSRLTHNSDARGSSPLLRTVVMMIEDRDLHGKLLDMRWVGCVLGKNKHTVIQLQSYSR